MHKIFFSLLVAFLCFTTLSQNVLNLENNLTGLYSQAKGGSQLGINYLGNNSLDFNKNLSLDLGTNYALRFSPKISENEFIQKFVLDYHKTWWDVFSTYQFNYSMIREIQADNWIGAGGGIKKSFGKGKVSLSYATLYQNQKFFNDSITFVIRHSVRGKIKVENKFVALSTEYFYQPSFLDVNDYLIYGTSKITILPKNSLSLIIQDVLNYRSVSTVKVLHNLTLGFSYKFSKEFKKP